MERMAVRYTFVDRHERMDLIRERDFDMYFHMLDESVAESRRIAATLMYAAILNGCVRIERGRREWHYLHRSVKYPGKLQITTWDEIGPVCDVMVDRPDDFSYLMNGTVTAYIEGIGR